MADFHAIQEIELLSYTEPWTPDMIESELDHRGYNHNLAAIDPESGAIAGYCFYWYVPQSPITVANIAVHPNHRKKGLATAMLGELIERGKTLICSGLVLEVRESNIPAQNLYQKLGFKAAGKRYHYYRNPHEDGIVMRLDF